MAYQSLEEIFTALDETRRRMVERVGALGEGEASARRDGEAWTVAEIVEHVSLVEKQIMKLTNILLSKAEAEGERASGSFEPVAMDKIIERSLREKYQAPENARPSGNVSITDSLALMRSSRERLYGLRSRLEAANPSSVSWPHPVFGALNLYEWLAMIGIHEDRHLRQIDASLALAQER
ncbi:MAG: DinB family protein [Acidobacteria bacterium]|nr:DinB family protein [Acidobacteriota bacterium]